MAGNVISIDQGTDKIYVHDGFSGVIDSSFSTPLGGSAGVTWDGTNIISADEGTRKVFKYTGKTSTVQDSFTMGAGISPLGLGYDGANVLLCDIADPNEKIYKLTGFSNVIDVTIAAAANDPLSCDWDGTNLISSAAQTNKIYQHDGFSTSILNSFAIGHDRADGVAWDGANVLDSSQGDITEKTWKRSGFSSSITDSFSNPALTNIGITDDSWSGTAAPPPTATGNFLPLL